MTAATTGFQRSLLQRFTAREWSPYEHNNCLSLFLLLLMLSLLLTQSAFAVNSLDERQSMSLTREKGQSQGKHKTNKYDSKQKETIAVTMFRYLL